MRTEGPGEEDGRGVSFRMGFGAVRVWARKWVQNPVVTLVVGVALLWSLLTLPRAWYEGQSTVGDWLARAVPILRSHSRGNPMHLSVYALREGGAFRVLDPDSDSWDEASRVMTQRPEDVYAVDYFPRTDVPTGFYAPTRLVTTRLVSITPIGRDVRDPTGDTRDAILSAFYGFLTRAGGGRWAQDAAALRAGNVEERRTDRMGYFHDVLAAVGLMVFLYSLAWIPRTPAYLATTRRQRALARGRCPHCGYSIVGLREPVCPECGRSWDVTGEDPPVDAGTGE